VCDGDGDCATQQRAAGNRLLNALARGVRAFQPDNVAGLLLASWRGMLRDRPAFISANRRIDHDEAAWPQPESIEDLTRAQ
jgi:hypothetical protein